MSALTATPLYGYTQQGSTPHYLRGGRIRSLCSRVITYVPAIQPVAPDAPCRSCKVVADIGGEYVTAEEAAPEGEGVCPGCGGVVALNDLAVVQPHGEYRIGRNGFHWSDKPCSGAGQAPEVTQ